ncbi:MAG TPA: pitrilysin family protein [Limnochordales bacterium]
MVQRTVLDNGVRVVTELAQDLRSVSLGFWFDVGSRDELPEQQGICHFLEHMMFKGTRRHSAREIAERIDALGGQVNAFTTREQTCYYARVLDEHLPEAVELLLELLLESSLSPEDIEKEKDVIVEEIRLYEDTPEEMVHDLAAQAALGRHPAARSVLGAESTVRALTRQDLVSFLEQHYVGPRLVVAACGRLEHGRLVEQLAGPLARLAGRGAVRQPQQPAGQSRWLVRAKETEQVHLCVTTPGLAASDHRRFALLVLDTVMGGGVSSRLFQSLREERGWVYSTYSYPTLLSDAGFFSVYAGTQPQRAPAVLDLIQQELLAVRERGVARRELERARKHLKGSLMLSLESTSQRMSRLARSELLGEEYLTPDEVLARIDAVHEEQVQELAAAIFDPDRFAFAGIGNVPWAMQSQAAQAG